MQGIDNTHKHISSVLLEVGDFLLESFNKIPLQQSRSFEYSQSIRKKAEKKVIDYVKKNKLNNSLITEIYGKLNGAGETAWHVHALDGAVNFATRTPCFGIAIGVTKNNEVIYGAIYVPYFKELFYAINGKGAFLNDVKIKVSAQKDLSYSIGTTTPLVSKKLSKPLKKLASKGLSTKAFRISSLGAGAFHGSYVACGRRDFWLSTDGPLYDVCIPASLIIREAGGRVTNFEGKEWKVGDLTLLGSNGKIHEKLLKIIN
jgi:myo-inositol-1(or 4)-monophosphatase